VYQASICKPATLRHFSFNTSRALEIVRTKTAEKVTIVLHNETHQLSVLLLLKTIFSHLCCKEKLLMIILLRAVHFSKTPLLMLNRNARGKNS